MDYKEAFSIFGIKDIPELLEASFVKIVRDKRNELIRNNRKFMGIKLIKLRISIY